MAWGVTDKEGWSSCAPTGYSDEFVRIGYGDMWLSSLYQTVGKIQFV
jgi:hypothetical protein